MSFRELRTFTEAMRQLGYPQDISISAFRTPNFGLVSNVLQWLVQRYDPTFNITIDVDTEEDRIFFLTSICSFVHQKLRMRLNPKKLYSGDGYAVQELAKIATLLASAVRTFRTSGGAPGESTLPDIKSTRTLASEITQDGAQLFDLLSGEDNLKKARADAISFPMELDRMEAVLQQQLAERREKTEENRRRLRDLESDRTTLQAKIEKKKTELQRLKNRLKHLQTVRPPFMDEYDRIEAELKHMYAAYVERFRNLDYLEHELEQITHREQEQIAEAERALSKMHRHGQEAKNSEIEEDDSFDLMRNRAPLRGRLDGMSDDESSLGSYPSNTSQSSPESPGFAHRGLAFGMDHDEPPPAPRESRMRGLGGEHGLARRGDPHGAHRPPGRRQEHADIGGEMDDLSDLDEEDSLGPIGRHPDSLSGFGDEEI
eukprot:gnl/Trimastix_PCT/1849.p1 GENE.gnl/Trimastix_PCT/1849~~gnl/Trimastix_PCT/1849.p1  ORF type:complete len:430 (-),score=137.21 gnl/Trimastix_PCT/1849:41-1330(-)